MRLRCIGLRIVRPFLRVGFDPRQIRPRLPAPGQARFRASPRQARPDYQPQAWGFPALRLRAVRSGLTICHWQIVRAALTPLPAG